MNELVGNISMAREGEGRRYNATKTMGNNTTIMRKSKDISVK
jgi:hypothetical protein